MGKPYRGELESLDATYAAAMKASVDPLAGVLADMRLLPLLAVGSGGSYTAAHIAARLHEYYCGGLARAATPLDATAGLATGTERSIMLLTAGGSNPDVLGAFRLLAESEPEKLLVLCGRARSKLSLRTAVHPYVDAFDFPVPSGKDGFLATNSALWFAMLLARAYREAVGGGANLPASLNRLLHPGQTRREFIRSVAERCLPLWQRPTLVVLYGKDSESAAIDLESKFTEAALGTVQLADFRNFAHGRHHWLAKRGAESAVLALVTDADAEMAARTLDLLPRSIPSVSVAVAGMRVHAWLAALVTGFYIAGEAGRARGIDPGRPGVPAFGRRIYNLRAFSRRTHISGSPSAAVAAAIERKSRVPLDALKERKQLAHWLAAYRRFTDRLFAARFSWIVLDYDGTLCATRDRFRGLSSEIATELSRLAGAGIKVCVVTGRGGSVRRDLQRELPNRLWDQFSIGYYNGSIIAPLTDGTEPRQGECCQSLAAVSAFLARSGMVSRNCACEPRPSQIVVRPQPHVRRDQLWEALQHAVSATRSRASVVKSGHSFDILEEGVSKHAVIERLQRESVGGSVLCIGDSGRWPGNDFSLLGHQYSLSVHEVSSDPGSCWNLAPPGQRGVATTLYYLRSLRTNSRTARAILRLPGHGG